MYDYKTVEYRRYTEAHLTTMRAQLTGTPGVEQQQVTEEILFAEAQEAAVTYHV